jgi:heptosyltransferase-2
MAHCQADPGVVRLPAMDLRSFCAVVAAAPAVISVDGAIVHAAVALQRPTVALFGPTDATIWFPYTRFGPYRVVSAAGHPAQHRLAECQQAGCMRAVTPERVEQALLEVLTPVPEAR